MNIFENCKNSKVQGTIGLGIAIQSLLKRGYVVSLPLNDSQEYDIIFDDCGKLNRVSVKTTSYQLKSGCYNFNLSTKGGNQSCNIIKKFDNSKCDYMFVVTGDETKYLIPSSDIKGQHCMTLHTPWNKYKI